MSARPGPLAHLPPRDEMPALIGGLHDGLTGALANHALEIPTFRAASELHVFSDYSDRIGRWRTASLLCMPSESVAEVVAALPKLRTELKLADSRAMEYKKFKDAVRWRALPRWLEFFDQFAGVSVTILVHEDVLSAFGENSSVAPERIVATIRDEGFGDWSTTASGARLLEDGLRIIHCVTYLHAFLSGPRTRLTWVTDNDEILAGPVRRTSVERLLPVVAEKYCGRPVDSKVIPEAEVGDPLVRDLLSIPDLMCAGILEHQRGDDAKANDMIAKAAVIMQWLGTVTRLQKLALQLTSTDGVVHWKLYRPYFQHVPVSP
jgi:hypothetical protein